FEKVGMVGVVGADFPDAYTDVYRHFGIDMEGLQKANGKTFKWSGVYEADMKNRRTLSTELNVFADFRPSLPQSYRSSPFLFLGNISPDLQLHVLDELDEPQFIVADTMDLWIKTTKDSLLQMISRVNMLMLNDEEARMLSNEHNIVKAARKILELGPEYVVVKKGEHGAILFSRSSTFMVPAYPLEDVRDPTGAGDTFAGGFMGAVAKNGDVQFESIRTAMLYGTVLASFGVEAFSLDRLISLKRKDIEARLAEF
ncbi:unnamed protein product, partial [marine sediment metagenome]